MKKITLIAIICKFQLISYAQTPSEINQAKEIIKNNGLNESQIRTAAKSKGYSDKQIDDLIKNEKKKVPRENQIDAKAFSTDIEENKSQSKVDLSNNTINETEVVYRDNFENENVQTMLKKIPGYSITEPLEYFGYDIFQKDPKLFQTTSVGAVDPNYLIGPGDEIIIMLWGETQFRQVLTVNREGFIFIPEIGQVFVNGLNLNLLESKLFKIFSQSYASINPQNGNPTTFLDVSLGELRPLRIQVLGQVAQPGAYTMSPNVSLFSSLYYFNGPTRLGSLRDIRLIRDGKQVVSIDFYEYLFTGKKPKDVRLQIDDVVFVPKRKKTVTIFGEINRPGIYELKAGETLKDLISHCAGLKVTSYLKRAQLDRIVPYSNRELLGMDRIINDLDLNNLLNSNNNFELQDGDVIKIFSISDVRSNVVTIQGAVERPGDYELGNGLKVVDLINKADSLLGDAYMERADVIRVNTDYTESLIKINLIKALEDDQSHNLNLNGSDKLIIYSISEMVPERYVYISGNVKKPGRYSLRKNMVLHDLIFLAGGFIDTEFKRQTYLERADLIRFDEKLNDKRIIPFSLNKILKKEGKFNLELLPNDQIRIYSENEIKGGISYVNLMGHVKAPGKYELYDINMTIKDLLFRGGGFNDPLHLRNTYLKRGDLIRFDQDMISQRIIPFNIDSLFVENNYNRNFKLEANDIVRIYSKKVFNKIHQVEIVGAVNNPGTYSFKTEMTIKDLILESGGIDFNFFRCHLELARSDSNTVDDDHYSDIYDIEINKNLDIVKISLLDNPGEKIIKENFYLMPFDRVTVKENPYSYKKRLVKINGEVFYPGSYTILNRNETLYDIINRAGGLKPNAYPDASTFQRAGAKININISKIIKSKRSKDNLRIMPGDEIYINPKPEVISVLGEVNSPGNYKFVSGKRINTILKEAGGLTPDAEKNNIFITYPGGKSSKYKRFFKNPKVKDGSKIFVGKKPEEEPFDKTEYLKELTTIFANFAQVMSLVLLAKS